MNKLKDESRYSVLKELALMRQRGEYVDLEIKCGEEKSESLFCHKIIVASYACQLGSQFLRDTLFRCDDQCVLVLPNISVDVMRRFLDEVYYNLFYFEQAKDILIPMELAVTLGLFKNEGNFPNDSILDPSLYIKQEIKSEHFNENSCSSTTRLSSCEDQSTDLNKNDLGEETSEGEEDFDEAKPLNVLEPMTEEERKAKESKLKKKKKKEKTVKRLPREWPCDECSEVLHSLRSNRAHKQRVHVPEEKIFISCLHCKKELKLRRFSKHLQKYHSLHVCDVCGESQGSWKKWYSHKAELHKMFTCKICLLECVGYNALRRHKVEEHDSAVACDVCGKVFATKKALNSHRLNHAPDKDKKYQCPYCGKGYLERTKMQSHISSIHTKDKPFFCRYQCGARYNDNSNVYKHEKSVHGRTFQPRRLIQY